MEISDLTAVDRELLQRLAEHVRQMSKDLEINQGYYPDSYLSGMLAGIEMVKNEIWRLSGSRPF